MQTNMETYFGYIKSPQEAIVLFEACRRGILSRVQRRLSEKERAAIRSGSVFVWDEREAGMRRWTDGRTWSPSRVSGSFLTYRELDSKRRGSATRSPAADGSQSDSDEAYSTGGSSNSNSSNSSSSSSSSSSSKPSFTYKPDGLIKQSFSICTANHQKLHLICYYTKQDILNERLRTPIHDDKLKGITIPKGMYPDTNSLEIPHPHSHHSSSPSSPTSTHPHHRSHPHTLDTYENNRVSPYVWPLTSRQRQLSSTTTTSSSSSSSFSHFTRATSSDSFMDPHDTVFPPTPPSMTSSPDALSEDELPDHAYHQSEPAYFSRRSSTLPILPPTPTSPRHQILSPYANQPSSYPHPHISVPPLATVQSPSDDIFPSTKGIALSPQDIPINKIRFSEDDRQLQALYAVLRL